MSVRNPQSVKALLFDLGGVLIDVDFERVFQCWQQRSRLSVAQMREHFSMDAAYQQHERGAIDAREYFAHLRDLLGLECTDDEITLGWNAIFGDRIAETIDAVRAARKKFPCFAFTNTNPTHQVRWTADYPEVVSGFDRIFVSSELGLRKPERAAFDAVVRAIEFEPAEILFFDDSQENVAGAHDAGLQALHVRGPTDVRQALIEVGAL